LLDPVPLVGAPIVSLYVVGLNHDPNIVNQTVRKIGVQELNNQIATDLPGLMVQHLVVAFSASGDIGKKPYPGAIGEPCDEGPYASAGPGMRHAGCLANMLEASYGAASGPVGSKFHLVEWEDDPKRGGGPALLTGWFWQPVEVKTIMISKLRGYKCPERDDACCTAALGVRLRSATPPDTPWEIVVYVAHTKGGVYEPPLKEIHADCPAWDPAKVITPYSSVGDIQALRIYAKEHERLGDLPPLLVGDFNWSYADQIVDAARPSFAAVDNNLVCAGSTLSLGLENDVMHAFAGVVKSADAPEGFVSQYLRQQVHYLRPVSARYTHEPLPAFIGVPRQKSGIDLPHILHNVVAVEFEVATVHVPPPRCGCSAGTGTAVATLAVGAWLLVWRRRRRRVS